mmetsp:Transcript_15168/g.36010  ORF Transcript_15168/g.36010 Transcript_15168/m.36010 type:complete len:207 (-) Transcript_15168:742-1362(-)
MSRPRAATSVAMSTRKRPLRKASMVFSRVACATSPCSGRASNWIASELTSSSQSLLVSQKTMTRPVAEVKDLITALTVIARSEYCAGMATCRTSVEALTAASPTRSTISGVLCMYLGASVRTHLGMVAEKRHVCRSACEHVPRIAFMSSWKPMSSIMSASSSVTMRTLSRARAPRSLRSLSRPGVPTIRSTPFRRALHCGPMGEPP